MEKCEAAAAAACSCRRSTVPMRCGRWSAWAAWAASNGNARPWICHSVRLSTNGECIRGLLCTELLTFYYFHSGSRVARRAHAQLFNAVFYLLFPLSISSARSLLPHRNPNGICHRFKRFRMPSKVSPRNLIGRRRLYLLVRKRISISSSHFHPFSYLHSCWPSLVHYSWSQPQSYLPSIYIFIHPLWVRNERTRIKN